MKNIEVEVRSFITKEEYKRLIRKFDKEAKFLDSINEETIYFKGAKGDLRLRRIENQSFIIFKTGKIHDDFREEIKIKFDKKDFGKIESLFLKLGFKDEIRWFRKRKIYQWGNLKVFLDDTKGYGFIVELEKIGKVKEEKKMYKNLKNKLKSLRIKIIPKKIFDKKFKYYKNNWQKILKYENRKNN